jgi:hypothetical protein
MSNRERDKLDKEKGKKERRKVRADATMAV